MRRPRNPVGGAVSVPSARMYLWPTTSLLPLSLAVMAEQSPNELRIRRRSELIIACLGVLSASLILLSAILGLRTQQVTQKRNNATLPKVAFNRFRRNATGSQPKMQRKMCALPPLRARIRSSKSGCNELHRPSPPRQLPTPGRTFCQWGPQDRRHLGDYRVGIR
jgi:hypothetical protein